MSDDIKYDSFAEAWKAANIHGILPIDPTGGSTFTPINLTVDEEMALLIEYSADLLALGKVKPGEWFKLKSLIKTEQEDNLRLVRGILDAKSNDKESNE